MTAGPAAVGGMDTREPFVVFYERELVGHVRQATLLLGSRDAAADAVHDVFVEVYRSWDDLAEPGPYLQRSVLNRCRDRLRREAIARDRLPVLLGCRPGTVGPWIQRGLRRLRMDLS